MQDVSVIAHEDRHPASCCPEPVGRPPGLRSLYFSTDEVCASERFEVWHGIHAAALDLTPRRKRPNFRAWHRTWDLGGMAFQTAETDGLHFASIAGRTAGEPLDHWVVSLFVTGSYRIEGASAMLADVAGTPLILSLADRFDGQVTRNRAHTLFIPRDTCRDCAHLLDAASLSLLSGGMGGIFADHMLSLHSRMDQLQPADLPELTAATRSLLLAAISPSPGHLEEAGALINQALLERARQCVQDNLRNPALDVHFVLRSLGVSRSRLYRLFEASGGIMHYIQKRRLAAAHKVLADPLSGRRIFEVAEDFCFNDAAEFSRAFRRQFAYTPSDLRAGGRKARDGYRPPNPLASHLSDLLKRL